MVYKNSVLLLDDTKDYNKITIWYVFISEGSYYKKPKKVKYKYDVEAASHSSVASNDKTPLIHPDENSKG